MHEHKHQLYLYLKNIAKHLKVGQLSYWIMTLGPGIEILRSRRSLVVVAGMKKSNDHAEHTKVEHLKKHNT